MLGRENEGVAGLPIIVILCVFLGAIALSLGIKGLDRARGLVDDQRAIQSFNKLVEAGTELSYGGMGNEKRVRLKLPKSKIHVDGRLIKLKKENQSIKVETLPLPLRRGIRKEFSLESGIFLLELEPVPSNLRTAEKNGLELGIRRIN